MDFHFIQIAILLELAKYESLKFGQFQTLKDLEKDKFNYHLQTLVKLKYILKDGGKYSLTNKGKETISIFDFANQKLEKMPKVSIMGIVHTKENKILLSKRLKQPFLNHYTFITGKVKFGESLANAVIRESEEETGLTPTKYEHLGTIRLIDNEEDSDNVLQDIFFNVFKITEVSGELIEETDEAANMWVDFGEFQKMEFLPIMKMYANGELISRQMIFSEKSFKTKLF